MLRIILNSVVIASLLSPVWATEIEEARSAIDNGDIDTALAILEQAVALNERAAMTMLAALYQRGEGVEKDPGRAIELYERAAQLGDADAQFNLGNIHLLGEGVQADEAWALTYYRQAASQGHELAARNMRELYRAAGLEPPDFAVTATTSAEPQLVSEPALETESLAPTTQLGTAAAEEPPLTPPAVDGAQGTTATAGPSDDTLSSGAVAAEALAVPQPVADAVALASPDSSEAAVADGQAHAVAAAETPNAVAAAAVEAATRISTDEAQALRMAKAHGIEVEIEDGREPAAAPPADSRVEALAGATDALAREEFDGALATIGELAEDDFAPAQYQLSRLHLAGHGVAQDTGAALAWLHRAADGQHPDALYDLGNRYLLGAEVEPDDAMAITLFRDAARQGHRSAHERLAAIYTEEGLPMPDLTRPRTPVVPAGAAASTVIAHAEVSADTAVAERTPPVAATSAAAADDAVQDTAPATIEQTPSVQPEPEPSAASEPYEFAIIEHDDSDIAAVNVDEIDPPRPTDHQILSGGELAQTRGAQLPEVDPDTLLQDLPPVEDVVAEATIVAAVEPAGDDVAMTADANVNVATSPPLEPPVPVLSATVAEVGTEPAGAADSAAAEEQVSAAATVAATTTAVATVSAGAHVSTTAAAAASEMGAAAAGTEAEKRGLLTKLKDAFVGADKAGAETFVSRAPGSDARAASASPVASAAVPEALTAPAAAADDDIKLAKAEPQAPAPRPVTIADAKAALAAGDLTRAANLFTTLAERGDAEAQAHVGYMTYTGEGVERDAAKAVEWYRKSAVQGNKDAQYNIAVSYAFGEGVQQSDEDAILWYRRAAEQGSAIAQFSLGVSYTLGEGVEPSDAEAAKWYQAAASQGYPAAQYNLAYMYRAGKGLERNDTEALKWFLHAAQNGHASAQYSLGYMYRSGRGAEKDVDEAIRWYRRAADQGHAEARADLNTLAPGG